MGPNQLPSAGPWQATPLHTLHARGTQQGVVWIPQQDPCCRPSDDEY